MQYITRTEIIDHKSNKTATFPLARANLKRSSEFERKVWQKIEKCYSELPRLRVSKRNIEVQNLGKTIGRREAEGPERGGRFTIWTESGQRAQQPAHGSIMKHDVICKLKMPVAW